jgi:phenolic acid decarboxylase
MEGRVAFNERVPTSKEIAKVIMNFTEHCYTQFYIPQSLIGHNAIIKCLFQEKSLKIMQMIRNFKNMYLLKMNI